MTGRSVASGTSSTLGAVSSSSRSRNDRELPVCSVVYCWTSMDRCEESIEVEEEHDELRHVELVVQDHVAADAEQHAWPKIPIMTWTDIDGVDATGVGVGHDGAHHMSVISDVARWRLFRVTTRIRRATRKGPPRRSDSVAREEVALLRRLVIPDRKDDGRGTTSSTVHIASSTFVRNKMT